MKTRDEIQEECLGVILLLRRSSVGLAMGVGKTLVGLRHMAANYTDYARFLVAVPKNTIRQTWIDEAKQFNLEYLLPHIVFTTYMSLPKQDLDYDVIYLDECHALKESHEPWLSAYTGKILGLTGTPPKRRSTEKWRMVNRYCPIAYTYITDSAVVDEILNDYSIIVHTLKLDTKRTLPVSVRGRSWFTSELGSYEYWTERINAAVTNKDSQIMRIMRMKALMSFPSKERAAEKLFREAKDKVILFANTQEQADRLCAHSHHSGNPGSKENLEKFKSGELMKLSCVLQLSEGVNIPNLKTGIIMHAYGNERKASQRIGRMMRLNPKEVSTIHILCYAGTVDEVWVKEALEDLDQSKINWVVFT